MLISLLTVVPCGRVTRGRESLAVLRNLCRAGLKWHGNLTERSERTYITGAAWVNHVQLDSKLRKISIVVRARCVYCMHPPRRGNTGNLFKELSLSSCFPLYDIYGICTHNRHTRTQSHRYTDSPAPIELPVYLHTYKHAYMQLYTSI